MLLVPYDNQHLRLMMFIDGQALSAAYARTLGDREPAEHVARDPAGFIWSDYLNLYRYGGCNVVKRYYYASSPGSAAARDALHAKIQANGLQTVRVYPRSARRRRCDAVVGGLICDLLTQAHRGSFDAAIIAAGSPAYAPALDAMQALGRRVYLWFFSDLTPRSLRRRADHFLDIGQVLLLPTERLAEHFS